MNAMSYDSDKTPLGKLSQRTLYQGFEILKDLAELLLDPSLAESKHKMSASIAMKELSNAYYTAIPHNFGRRRPPIIDTDDLLKREVELLESLGDMSIAEEIMKDTEGSESIHPLDRQFAGLNLTEMMPLDQTSGEYTELWRYLMGTHGHTHAMSYEVSLECRCNKTCASCTRRDDH